MLVAYSEIDPETGHREVERLIDYYPSQRPAALRAKVRLLARAAANEQRLARLDEVLALLPKGPKGFLAETSRLRDMVSEISRLQQRLDTLDRPFLREPTADLLCEKIKNFHNGRVFLPASGAREVSP